MKKVTVYSTPICGYCRVAKMLLTNLNIPFEEIDLLSNDKLRQELAEKYHWQSVPMIVIGDQFIGGLYELQKLNADGTLMDLLEG